jgi:hypothetical protein
VITDKVGRGESNVTYDIITNASDPVLVPVAGHYRIRVKYNGDLVEDSGDLADRASAVAWAANSAYIGVGLGADPAIPVAVTNAALTGGVDDHASVTNTQLQAALDKFNADLGPGQVSMPGYTSDAAHAMLVSHALANNRTFVLDLPDTASDATLKSSSLYVRGLGRAAGSAKGACFAPWDVAPGEFGPTSRTVPPSWRQMATMGRNDASGLSPNEPSAGDNGQGEYVTGLSQPAWSPAVRQSLHEAGVNVSIMKYGVVTTYGNRTPVDQVVDKNYSLLSNQRLEMAIRAEFKLVEDNFQFKELDGFRRNINKFVSRLDGVCQRWWAIGSLKGDTPGEAYSIDGGTTVNTDQTMANGELRAETVLRMSPHNERTIIGIAKVPSQEAI